MSETSALLYTLGDVGIEPPQPGDLGDIQVRAALQRELARRPSRRARWRVRFGRRSVAVVPALLLATGVTAAAAGTLALVNASPSTLFQNNPQNSFHETVIGSTVRRITQFEVPGVGTLQYWVATTKQGGLCQAMRMSNDTWAVMGANLPGSSGEVPGCTPTRKQQVIAQGNSRTGLLPMSVDERSIGLRNRYGNWFVVYYGVVDAVGATAVRDPANGRRAPLIDGRYFVMVVPAGRSHHGMCIGCDTLRAIDSAGRLLPADYGPAQERNH